MLLEAVLLRYRASIGCLIMGIAVIGSIACRSLPDPYDPTPPEIAVISRGTPVDLKAHARQGVVTVFDFYAHWCSPCRQLDRSLRALHATYGSRLVILKLDVVDFDSALARAFSIRDLPYLIVYNEDQSVLAEGPSAQVLPQLIDHLNR